MTKTNDLLGFLEGFDFRRLRQWTGLLSSLIDHDNLDPAANKELAAMIDQFEEIRDMAAERGVEGAFIESKNENCLAGIICPKCDNEDSFEIVIVTNAIVTDEGSEPVGDQEWDEKSHIRCRECGESGRMWQFRL